MKSHVVIDLTTGQVMTQGRDGRRYTADEVKDAHRRARRGDADAKAVIENIDLTAEFADGDPRDVLKQMMHDCPECRAQAALGVPPSFSLGMGMGGMIGIEPRAARDRPKLRRWREQRRRRG